MKFNSLPLEIHLAIFSYLPVRDVMSIRRVCKLWNGLINGEFKFKRLRCFQPFDSEDPGEREKSYDFVFTSTRSFLDQTSTDLKFSRVRYLDAFLNPKWSELQDTFDFLNSFKSLEEISFRCYVYGRLNEVEGDQKKFLFSLPRLEKATIYLGYTIEAQNLSVLLDLPNLVCLSINSLAGITVGYPEKLRTLATRSLFGGQVDYSKFTSLTNIFTGRRDLPSISASFLERLSSLRELHVSHVSFWGDLLEDYRLPEPSLSKASPKIFFYGFEVSAREIESEGAQWPRIGSDSTGDSARFITRNLHRSVDDNPRVYSIDYNTIAGELNDSEMLGVMPRKLSKITHLRISGTVVDENRLFKFIDKFRVSSFEFERTSLPQPFFKKLTENCPFISSLTITEPTISILTGDFDFVFEFKNLKSLHFQNCPLSLKFVARAIKELKSLSCLQIGDVRNYQFSLWTSKQFTNNSIYLYVDVHAPRLRNLGYRIPTEEALDWVNVLQRQLSADGAVCPRQLQTQLDHLRFEKENALFWMRKYLYDQRHSICLSEKQMRLLNLRY